MISWAARRALKRPLWPRPRRHEQLLTPSLHEPQLLLHRRPRRPAGPPHKAAREDVAEQQVDGPLQMLVHGAHRRGRRAGPVVGQPGDAGAIGRARQGIGARVRALAPEPPARRLLEEGAADLRGHVCGFKGEAHALESGGGPGEGLVVGLEAAAERRDAGQELG